MRCTIEASESPVRVDQSDNEGDSTGFPPGVVDERSEDERGMLMCWCYRWHRDKNDDE